MNKLKKYTYLLGVALVALATACEDQSEEVLSIDYSRYFAPINLEARCCKPHGRSSDLDS